MNDSNRRNFIKTVGVGAAAAGAVALVPAATGTASSAPAATPALTHDVKLPAAAKGSMVAYIHDVSTGQIAVMVEGHEVTVTDHQLVAKLAHALHSGGKV